MLRLTAVLALVVGSMMMLAGLSGIALGYLQPATSAEWLLEMSSLAWQVCIVGLILVVGAIICAAWLSRRSTRNRSKSRRAVDWAVGTVVIFLFINASCLSHPSTVTKTGLEWSAQTFRFGGFKPVQESRARELLWSNLRFASGWFAFTGLFLSCLGIELGTLGRVMLLRPRNKNRGVSPSS
jgi:hypothetical protein